MIVLENLGKSFDRVNVLRGLSWSVETGETVVVRGRSGCGKTTLLRLVAGLERPDDGRIKIDGVLASQRGWVLPPHRRSIGMVFQTPSLWPHMTVAGNVRFGLSGLSRKEADKRVAELLERMDIAALSRRHPDEISVGQARRVALARALAPRPKRLLLDEPLVNLDVELKSDMRRLILDGVRATGATLIVVTHEPEEAAAFAGRCFTLRNGRLEETDSKA